MDAADREVELTSRLACGASTTALKISPDGNVLASLHVDSVVRLWDAASLKPTGEIAFDESVRDFAISPDRDFLIAITACEVVGQPCAVTSTGHVYNIVDQKFVHSRRLADCRCAVFLDQDRIAIGRLGRGTSNDRNMIDICRSTTLETASTITLPDRELCFQLSHLPSLGALLVCGIGIVVIDFKTLAATAEIHCDNIGADWDIWETSCMFTQRSTNQVAAGFDAFHGQPGKRICVLDAKTWQRSGWYVEESRCPKCVAISNDGQLLASTLYDLDTVFVHDISSGRRLVQFDVLGASAVAFLPGS